MIDVHAPHETVHTWRDFFIHIATIVVGLLIAIGLEQTVEYFHRRHEVTETREALRLERKTNHKAFAVDVAALRYQAVLMHNNLLVLDYEKQHPGTPLQNLPGIIHWGTAFEPFNDSAWHSAQITGVAALMPPRQVETEERLYQLMALIDLQQADLDKAVTSANQDFRLDPDPSHLSVQELDADIQLTKAAITANMARLEQLRDLNHYFGDFQPAPSLADLGVFPDPSPEMRAAIAAPTALTHAREAATRAKYLDAEKAFAAK